jgi:hypothetical protein
MSKIAQHLCVFLPMCGTCAAQEPVAQLPAKYIGTSYTPPSGGTTWAAPTAAQLVSAINAAQRGDIIVLDAGVTYVGNFQLSGKSNPYRKWIYVSSSKLANVAAGTRVSPASAPNMSKLITPNTLPVFQVNGGANHWRFAEAPK